MLSWGLLDMSIILVGRGISCWCLILWFMYKVFLNYHTFLKAFFKVLIACFCSFGLYFNCLYCQDKCLVCGLVVLWCLSYLESYMLFCFLLIMMKLFIYYPCFHVLLCCIWWWYCIVYLFASFAIFCCCGLWWSIFLFLPFNVCLKIEELVPAVQFFFSDLLPQVLYFITSFIETCCMIFFPWRS